MNAKVRKPTPAARARKLVADVIDGAIRSGDDWTWKTDGVDDPELTAALRVVAEKLRAPGRGRTG